MTVSIAMQTDADAAVRFTRSLATRPPEFSFAADGA
jgi:hypothetical protein